MQNNNKRRGKKGLKIKNPPFREQKGVRNN